MQRFFRNAGVLLKWVLLAPFLLIKGYLWILFVAPYKLFALEEFEFPQSWEAFDLVMRTEPTKVLSGLVAWVIATFFVWMVLVVIPYMLVISLQSQSYSCN